MDLYEQVGTLKGVGTKKCEALHKLNIETVEDLLYSFPRDYEDRRKVTPIEECREDAFAVVKARIVRVSKGAHRYGKKQLLKLLVSDDTGFLEIVFFNGGYLTRTFESGGEFYFFGRVGQNYGTLQMIHPEYSKDMDKSVGILPVYPLTKGISQHDMRNWHRQACEAIPQVEDTLSQKVVDDNRLCDIQYALRNIHFPEGKGEFAAAKFRLIFEELLVLQVGMIATRRKVTEGIAFDSGAGAADKADVKEYIDSLPYPLTGAQARCVSEIIADLEGSKAMNRLLQGDVGSGKTAVAEIALYKAVRSSYQAVMMAPTEILARQHYDGISKSFARHGIKVGFLSGNMKAAEKRETLEQVKTGEIQVLIGTHAVIQPDVEFHNLGLVITDEQHRFGVNQRIKLKEKGEGVNILVMTATPIPRTLSVIMYGDLDISIIDELPPGRQEIVTKSLPASDRNRCYDFVKRELAKGRQAYVVAPLIEDSDLIDARSAESIAKDLDVRLAPYRVALLHGAMKQTEKDEIMGTFYRGEIHVLVATVVIEVGINVPNATVMVIENYERFGLAQLHQLRGRVGRGEFKSYCFLVMEKESQIAKQRGEIMEKSRDGFYIAEEDLKIRGPGEVFGTRQHGLPDLNISDLARNLDILQKAKTVAAEIVADDTLLQKEENQPIRRRVVRLFGEDFSLNL